MPRRPCTSAQTPRHRAAGVTLLEMLLVVGLIALVSILTAVSLGGGLEGMRLRASTKEIASQLRHVRALALVTGHEQRFLIDPVTRRWETSSDRHGSVPDSLDVSFTGARQAQLRQAQGGIVFFPDGGSTGGRVQLQARDAVWRVDVSWVTGEVRLARMGAAATAP